MNLGQSMAKPVSVRIDEEDQRELMRAARERGLGLSSYLRALAAREAHALRRERIRVQSRAVGEHHAASADARAFHDDWGGSLAAGP
jgi:uncharacterized protein (DUF1778 family)